MMDNKDDALRKRCGIKNAVCIAVILVALAVIIAILSNVKRVGTPNQTKTEVIPKEAEVVNEAVAPVEDYSDSIIVPGYISLTFQADETVQNMALMNPPENTCWFRMSLVLNDGTPLWTSDLVAPGDISNQIIFSQSIPKGEYPDSLLIYECFADKEGTKALDGANTELTILAE